MKSRPVSRAARRQCPGDKADLWSCAHSSVLQNCCHGHNARELLARWGESATPVSVRLESRTDPGAIKDSKSSHLLRQEKPSKLFCRETKAFWIKTLLSAAPPSMTATFTPSHLPQQWVTEQQLVFQSPRSLYLWPQIKTRKGSLNCLAWYLARGLII